MRRLRTVLIIAIIGSFAFAAGRATAGGPAPSWTFVKDSEGVSWLVINDQLIGIPYYPVPEDEWVGFQKSGLWAIPQGDSLGYGPCPSWYQQVCDPLGRIRVPLTDVIAIADETPPEPPPSQPPVILERAPAPTATSIPSASSNAATKPTGFDASAYLGQGDKYNCDDFASQADAQAVLRADPRDPNRLDTDKDGIACENNRAPKDTNPVPR